MLRTGGRVGAISTLAMHPPKPLIALAGYVQTSS